MKVLLISHTCQSRTEGLPKADHLARRANLQLMVLVPELWRHYGAWRPAEAPDRPGLFSYEARPVACPWLGPAQNYLHWYPCLTDLLTRFRPDIIDLWEEPWSFVSAHACWLRNRLLPQARVICETEQNTDKVLPFPFERFRSFTLRHSDFAIGRNAEAVEVLHAKGYAGPTAVVPNAVDPELFRPMDSASCRMELGLGGFVVGYVGRLVEEKGLVDLIDALAKCPPHVRVLFAGSGPMEVPLRDYARATGQSDRVRFIGACAAEELARVMNAIDVLVLPSRTTTRWKEQFGRVIIEAHACGTPVIGSNSGAIPEVVGEGGLIVPERDPAELAKALARLAGNPSRGRELGSIGRQQVLANYTWDRVASRVHDIYRQVLKTSPKVAAKGGSGEQWSYAP